MIRKIIHIDEDKCNGCGICAEACHEGAIEMVEGKAKLVREDFCDGLGDCLPACPMGAIRFEEREAPAYDEAAVKAAQTGGAPAAKEEVVKAAQEKAAQTGGSSAVPFSGCAGSAAARFGSGRASRLAQWPCQIKLIPTRAPYFDGADLLIAADCTAFAYAGMHEEFMKDRITLIGCPKLDAVDYSEKLTEIIAANDIRTVTIARMEVPCCGGLQRAVTAAVAASGKDLPLEVVTISRDGKVLTGN